MSLPRQRPGSSVGDRRHGTQVLVEDEFGVLVGRRPEAELLFDRGGLDSFRDVDHALDLYSGEAQ